MNTHKYRRTSHIRGFTLIELLVVVAIIALLISILLPSLGKARAQAKQAVCGANLHSIGTALATYASEYEGVWPAPGCADAGWNNAAISAAINGSTTPVDRQGNFSWIANFLYPRITGQQLDPGQYPYVYYNASASGSSQAAFDFYNKDRTHDYLARTVFICPAATFSDAAAVPGAEVITGGQFTGSNWKALSYGFSARLNSVESGPQSSVLEFKRDKLVKNPGLTALVTDSSQPWVGTLIGAPANINVQLNFLQAGAIRHPATVSPRGALGNNSSASSGVQTDVGRPNFLMADYHVEPINYRQIPNYPTTTAASAALDGSRWYQFWFGDR